MSTFIFPSYPYSIFILSFTFILILYFIPFLTLFTSSLILSINAMFTLLSFMFYYNYFYLSLLYLT